MKHIIITGANEHNLRNVTLSIPRNALVVVTGVSGSGKSSLAFETLNKEGQRRFMGSFSSYARQFLRKMGAPEVEKIEGLSPTLSIDQKTIVRNPRSTVGTLSEINDSLRLLFARLGDGASGCNSNLFSFNSPHGACENCKGLGIEDRIDPDLLVEDPAKTIREGALVITTPTGYIIYSQVTLDVLNQVCEAHGFNVDIPWRDMTEAQLDVVLNGSERIKISYGKHPLENRLKWSGITAKPREESYYKGILPVMQDILKRDRNKNILRFARSNTCSKCHGSRLNPESLRVQFKGMNFAEITSLTIDGLHTFFEKTNLGNKQLLISSQIQEEILSRTKMLRELGLGYLALNRESTHLSGGEAQRIRLVNQVASKLQGVLYVLDEPSIGLHPIDNNRLLNMLQQLRDMGNSLVIVEHDEETMLASDWIVDIGPGAGIHGGKILFSGPPSQLLSGMETQSRTGEYLSGTRSIGFPKTRRTGEGKLTIEGARKNNLKNVTATFMLRALNVVTGVSGAGKSSLIHGVLAPAIAGRETSTGECNSIRGMESIVKLIEIDQAPIGRTPRSNPATYTKLFDLIRDLFSKTKSSKEAGFGKGRFSFNNKGGRCETCFGAGVLTVGMHFLENVSITCEICNGKRFNDHTLSIRYNGLTINEVLELSVDEAASFFSDQHKIMRFIAAMQDVGLGYIKLGQPSTTLSGGEAQRVKLASQLGRPTAGHTLFILDEPTTGLHADDIVRLLKSLNGLIDSHHTVIVIEHHLDFILAADQVIDLGPGSGIQGGEIVAQGTPEFVSTSLRSVTAPFMKTALSGEITGLKARGDRLSPMAESHIQISGAKTHNLKNIDVSIEHGAFTVITGVSGSGKSSLAFDTLYAQGRRMFCQSMSSYARRFFKQLPKPLVDSMTGLSPTIAIGHHHGHDNPRSIVATSSGIYDLVRLMYSRAGIEDGSPTNRTARMFSFNLHSGSCTNCRGLGVQTVCDPKKLVSNPRQSILTSAMDGTKSGRFYGDPNGQYTAVLQAVGQKLGFDYTQSWQDLPAEARRVAMHGTGDRTWSAVWKFNRKGRSGEHTLNTRWPGFCGHVEEEYLRVHADHRGTKMMGVMKEIECSTCQGERLSQEARSVTFAGVTLPDLTSMSVASCNFFFQKLSMNPVACSITASQQEITQPLQKEILVILKNLEDVGLGYLGLNRKTSTLSGGERQRLRLASALGSNMCGVTYVFDEPTLGLHGRDTEQLILVLKELRDQGNTIVVVEHDEAMIRTADQVIDMGPGAGTQGGTILARGTVAHITECEQSITGKYLKGELSVAELKKPRKLKSGISIENVHANNLKIPNIRIPSCGMISISGVSGSGKSSLVFDVIMKSYLCSQPIGCENITGFENFSDLHLMDQSPIGSSPTSNLLTFCLLFDPIKKIFANQPKAIKAGFKRNRFSFNAKEGRCPSCSGMGHNKVEMGFLADVWIPCDACEGKRYNHETLKIEYKEHNIYQILKLSVEEAVDFFADNHVLSRGFKTLEDVGLGYLALGQSANTLSGGEAQRLKLARALLGVGLSSGPSLYIFDEPTTGLHFQDVSRLLRIFTRLTNSGHTVLIVEHNLDIIAASDWVIDLGPEGGDQGGQIVVSGTPKEIAACKESWTGHLLRAKLKD